MELLVCILNEPGRLNDVMAAMVESEISGATVVESQGMGKILSQDVPIFAGFRHILAASKPYNYTILSVIEDPNVVDVLLALLKDLLPSGGALVFTLPLSRFERLPSSRGKR